MDRSVVWGAGGGFQNAAGAVVRTVDGGRSWQDVTPPGGGAEEIRDVEAFDRHHALVLVLRNDITGEPSRIYRTADGGATWQSVFRADPVDFFDCMAFFDHRRGLAVGDAVDGKFPVLATVDGGRTWHPTPANGMPGTVSGEGALATGTCLVTKGRHDAWFGTTGIRGPTSRNPQVFHTRDGGTTWTVTDTPIPGATASITSLSFRDRRHGLATGGNFNPSQNLDLGVAARTPDGGASWALGAAPAGFRNSVAWIPGHKDTAIAVGPNGSDISTDGGRAWTPFDNTLLMGINCSSHGDCWAVGKDGLAARLVLRRA